MPVNNTLWRQHAWRNRLQTLTLMLLMGGFLALLGWLLWGAAGLVMLLVSGTMLLLLRPLFSPLWLLRLYGAEALTPQQAPDLFALVAELSRRAGLDAMPGLFYLPNPAVNAFTIGDPRESAITLSDGLLRLLNRREVIGVLAHEISHIRSNDMRVMELADHLSRMTSILSLFGLMLLLLNLPLLLLGEATFSWLAILLLLLAPHASALAQLGLSRTREYDADLNAARLSGDPQGLAMALVRIERLQGGWLEQLLLPGRRLPLPSLLRTHPPNEERVRRLLSLQTQEQGYFHPITGETTSLWHNHGVSLPRWHIGRWWY